jgi:hypothetical protein
MQRRRCFKQTIPLKDRLASFAKEARDRGLRLPPGSEREAMLKKVSQADTAAHLDERANSPGLQPPK